MVSEGLGLNPRVYNSLNDLPKYANTSKINHNEINKNGQFREIFYRTKARNLLAPHEKDTYVNVFIAIDFAMWMDVDLKHEVIKTFIEHKILEKRDNGGVAFNKLNSLINTLEDGNNGCHRHIAELVNAKVNGGFDKGWNDENKQASEQKLRVKYLDQLSLFIEMGFVTTYQQLKQAVRNLK